MFPAVAPGTYKVAAEFAGMAKFEATVEVQTQQSATLDITLQPAGTQTVVSVQDATPVLTTDTSTLSHTLERTRIEQLPINGRIVDEPAGDGARLSTPTTACACSAPAAVRMMSSLMAPP